MVSRRMMSFLSLYHAMEAKQRLGMVVYGHAGLRNRLCFAFSLSIVNYIHQIYSTMVPVMRWLVMHPVLIVKRSCRPYHFVVTHSRCTKHSEQRPAP